MSSASWLCKGLTGDEAQLNALCPSALLLRHASGLTFNKHFKRSIIFQLHRFASSFRTQSKSARQNDNETVDNMNEPRAGAGPGRGGRQETGTVSLGIAFQRSVAFASILHVTSRRCAGERRRCWPEVI